MTARDAKAQLHKGVTDYDDGVITLSALLTLIDLTIDTFEESSYAQGLNDAEIDGDPDEEEIIDFDPDMDLDGEDE